MEIERKFLVKDLSFQLLAKPKWVAQGYLVADGTRTVRVRVFGEQAFLTIKSKTIGISREEFEYEIPVDEAKTLLKELCDKPLIEKQRYAIPYAGKVWEVDVFGGENEGLVIAEIELTSESEKIAKPEWVGEEVSGDPKYFNSNLVKYPYLKWKVN